jgi:hypothetical protein
MKTKGLFAIAILMLNLLVGGLVAAASGLSPLAVIGGGAALSLFASTPKHVFSMAIQKEIWMTSIVEGLFADNLFISKAFNADEFVNAGKTVHIPNAGAPSSVSKNRNSFPASVTTRTDTDLTFDLDEFTTDPIRIPHADTVELSYNKRESVLRQDKAKLVETVCNDFAYKWSLASTYTIRTTGSAVLAHTASATGYRKAFTKSDVKNAMDYFNNQDIPQEGRYMLVDAVMYGQLLDSLTTQEAMAFHSQVDLANGVLGKLYGFNIMMRSKASRYTYLLVPKLWTAAGAATDHAAVLCWHTNSICRALGEVVPFESLNDPTYYGDIYSFLIRAGGRAMRNGVEGLLAIVQDTEEEPES